MNEKSFVNVILVIFVIMLISMATYLTLGKKLVPSSTVPGYESMNTATKQPASPSTTETSKPVDWKNLVPIIQTMIGPTFLGVRVGESPISIWQTSDITGDSVPEALVYLGQGGAYTTYLTLMRIENGKPVVAQFKQKDGKISPLIFLDGASVMNGESVVMLPEKNAIYAGHWSKVVGGEPYGGLSNCKVEAYQWNSQTRIFDFSQTLSNEIRPGYCQKVAKK